MRWTEVPVGTRGRPTEPATASTSPRRPDALVHGPRAGGDHPWRHAIEDHRVARQLAKDRRAWMAVQP